MALTTTGSPFSLNIPSASSDLADLFGSYLVPNMTAVNTYAAHKATAQTFSALQTFSAGLNVTAGNVGIGKSAYGSLTTNGVWLQPNDFHHISSTTSNAVLYLNQNGAGPIVSFLKAGVDKFHIDTNGYVGIGTTSPAFTLDVVAGANLAARFRGAAGQHTVVTLDSASDSYAPYLLFQRNGADKWLLQAWTDNNFYVLDDDLNNGVYIAQDTTSWVANSDARLKDVIGPIENATAKVNALSGVRYTWKRDADKSLAKVRVGLIAQDVFDVLPESVEAENPDIITDELTGKVSGGLGVRYTELVPLLVNAIKELAQRVEALEA